MRAKRALDIFFVILAAPWAVPVVIGSTVFLLASGSRTPFVGAWRVGRGGKYFRIWKLNTSIENSRNPYRQRNDPVGNFFRRTAADELPQLWNVLVGEMSLVGPHAYQPGYEPKDPNSAYYASKPGLTGPWQLAGPLNRSPALRERLDEEYSRRSSLVLDLTILFQTTGLALKELKEK
jgi:lipopolysaccharide/colanic/teichoic acid biosynthesis glycosyltransferase